MLVHKPFSMTISLQQVAKRFKHTWIFKSLTTSFHSGERYAITGPNGSGKSTLLQILAGNINLTAGAIEWKTETSIIHDRYILHQYLSLAAPYLELIEEMTAIEFLEFHFSFKHRKENIDNEAILALTGLQDAATKQIQYFSSGMKQRLKLAQAFFADTPLLFLDEPGTNLDSQGIQMYHDLLKNYSPGRLVIICSNDEADIKLCNHRIYLPDFKI